MEFIHERSARVKVFEIGVDKILIEGILRDERFCPSFIYSLQQFMDPGIVHRIIVRMVLSLPKLIIESAEAEMTVVPMEMCKEVKDVVNKLVGLPLMRGFRENVRKSLGGNTGCIHINNLLLFMNTAAIQGSYTYYSRVREDGQLKRADFDGSLIVNSCHLWREDGPAAQRLEEMQKARHGVRGEKIKNKTDGAM
jgi:hypothetical protein